MRWGGWAERGVRGSPWRLTLLALLSCAVAPASARAQDATASIGLSESAPAIVCVLAQLSGCLVPNPRHELFDRYQALSLERTDGANSFRYARATIPWDSVSTGAAALGGACARETPLPAYDGTPWIVLAERYVLGAREAGIDPLISITTNSAARYPGEGNANDPPNPSSNQYACGFRAIVSALDGFAARHGVAAPTEYETYNEADGAQVSNACNPTPDGDLPPHEAEQCAAWYYYEADQADRTRFAGKLTLVALAADGDSANDPNLIAIKGYGSYLTGTIGLYPTVWSFHPYEDLSAAAYLGDAAHSDTTRVSSYIASLYAPSRPRPAIWLTEVSAQITDPVSTYFGAPAGCNDGERDDPPPYTLGGCLDGNPRAQAMAAGDFLNLARSGSAFPGQITRIYWHGFDSPAGQPTTWDSALISPGDRYERASYCVLSGESIARTLTDSACNSKAGAEDRQDAVGGYPEPDAPPPAADPAPSSCPEPWCTFSLVRLRLSELGGDAAPESMVASSN